MFFKISNLKNFAIFTGKQSKGFNFSKKRFRHRCFTVNIAKFLRTSFSQNSSERLLLKFVYALVIVYARVVIN